MTFTHTHILVVVTILASVVLLVTASQPTAYVDDRELTPTVTTTPADILPPGIPVTATFTLPILALHHVGPAPAHLSRSARDWYISAAKFEALLQEIEVRELVTLTASELLDHLEAGYLPERAILLTFDDGPADFYTHAFPLMEQYDAKATMHLQSHVRSAAWLDDEQILELAASPLVEFGSHTKYHQYLTRVTETHARDELVGSKEKIESVIGDEYAVRALAYPYGLYNDDVEEYVADAGYEIAFTIDGGAAQTLAEPRSFTRIIITETTNLEHLLDQYYPAVAE